MKPPAEPSAGRTSHSAGRTIHVVGAAIVHRRRVLAARRGPQLTDAGAWEFPGGKVEPGESPETALEREIDEELGLRIEVLEHLGRGIDQRVDRTIVLDVHRALLRTDQAPRATDHDALRWLTADQLGTVEWAAADRPILAAVRRLLAGSPNS